jgi:hypothetical protein
MQRTKFHLWMLFHLKHNLKINYIVNWMKTLDGCSRITSLLFAEKPLPDIGR